ncbi:MAG: TIGR00730 family Rossman fold protein [Lachnospiraceae bacterium]|jgi:uncharacterized protein (TIGR00730 family)
MKICVYGAASQEIDKIYIETVENLCERLGSRGHNLIFGAGAGGLMGAAARGFHKGGGKVVGVVPSFFRDQNIEDLYEECDTLIYTQDMGDRKQVMEHNCDAFLIVPGGIGTFDEFFQILTLKQLGQMNKQVALFNIKGYYYSIQALMHNSAEEKFLRAGSLNLYKSFDEGEEDELIEYLETVPSDAPLNVKDLKYS